MEPSLEKAGEVCHTEALMLYADYNATTPLCPEARAAIMESLDIWGNPSSAHQMGRRANQVLNEARERVALAAQVKAASIVFTSGGSEANTLALQGSFFSRPRPFRIVTTDLEHSSVRDTLKWLQKEGASVLSLPVDRNGSFDLEQLRHVLSESDAALACLMAANNETGVVYPIAEAAVICREFEVPLHVDAVQAFGKIPTSEWNCADFVAISSHKIGGPKGVGSLLIPTGRPLVPTHFGGSQEVKRRGGTENLTGIIGFGAACTALNPALMENRIGDLRDRFEERLLSELGEITIQGATARRLPNTSNLRLHGISSEILLSALDLDGLCVSAGSACSSGSISPSHVLLAMGLAPHEAKECVRFSWGRETTAEQVDSAAELVISHVKRIRARRRSLS